MPKEIIPYHKWTDDGDRVLILKCVKDDMTSHGGFVWPESGPVKPESCSPDDGCNSGGLFGWAWGFALGDARYADFGGTWIVFSAPPEQVHLVDGKVKVAATTPDEVDAVVEYCGPWAGALGITRNGRLRWAQQNSRGELSSGNRSASLSLIDNGIARTSGTLSAAVALGSRSIALSRGTQGLASSHGGLGIAITHGFDGHSESTGPCNVSVSIGNGGMSTSSNVESTAIASGSLGRSATDSVKSIAASTGPDGSSFSTGGHSCSSSTSSDGRAVSTGNRSVSSTTSDGSSSKSTGSYSIAASPGIGSEVCCLGPHGAAVLTGNAGTIRVSGGATGLVTDSVFMWQVEKDAVVFQRWFDGNDICFKHAVLEAKPEWVGKTIRIIDGQHSPEPEVNHRSAIDFPRKIPTTTTLTLNL